MEKLAKNERTKYKIQSTGLTVHHVLYSVCENEKGAGVESHVAENPGIFLARFLP